MMLAHKRWTGRWRGPVACRRVGAEQAVPDGGLGATCFGSLPEPARMALDAFLTAARSRTQASPGVSP